MATESTPELGAREALDVVLSKFDGPLPRTRSRARFYSSPAGGPTSRRVTDGLIAAITLLGLGLLVVAYPPGQFERALATFLASFPDFLDPVWQFFFDAIALWALVLLVVALVTRPRKVGLQAAAACVVAAVLSLVATRLALGHWPDIGRTITGISGAPAFPVARIAEAGAIVLTVGTQLVRGLQRAGRWMLAIGFVGSLLIYPGTPGGSLAAILAAIAAAAGVRLAFGTSLGRPGIGDVAAALDELGVPVAQLESAQRQPSGVFELDGRDQSGLPLLVKVYGRDAYDTQLVASLWRKLSYQGSGAPPSTSRMQAVQNEALTTLLTARAGVATRTLVTAGGTSRGDAVIVLSGRVRPLTQIDTDAVDAGLLGRFWEVLATLHAGRLAHGGIDTYSAALVDGEPGFVDLGHGTLSPTADQILSDRAQLLASIAAVAGERASIDAAVAALGADGVTEVLPYLQPPALGGRLRRALKERDIDVDDLRAATAEAVGAEPPELVKLRRVTGGTILQLGLLVFAVLAIVKFAGNIDFTAVKDDLSNASWSWLVFAVFFAQIPRVTQAVSTLGSIASSLRFGPVYILQLATSYLNLALPSSLARMTVFIRFFQRQGLPPAAAVTAGAIDSLAGNVLQVVLVVTIALFSSAEVSLGLAGPDSGALHLLWILLGVVAVVVLVVFLVGRIRRAIVSRVRAWLPQVRSSLGALRQSNKLILLVGGNLATEVLFAASLGLIARGFGYHIPLTALILVNAGTSLFSSLIPVPGGIGVVEFGLEVGLTSAGMTPSAAAATVLIYRLATFYLPPTWGFVAFRWLQRNSYL
jgi:uncharacterized membrane protein YbhN (UPF0104 family)